MKIAGFALAGALALSIMASPAIASDGTSDTNQPTYQAPTPPPGGMMGRGPGQMMMENQKMMQEGLTMLRDTMQIVKDLNTAPTADQKAKLDSMIKRMDEMIKRHEEMIKQMPQRPGMPPR